jgi:hypothetical protein
MSLSWDYLLSTTFGSLEAMFTVTFDYLAEHINHNDVSAQESGETNSTISSLGNEKGPLALFNERHLTE